MKIIGVCSKSIEGLEDLMEVYNQEKNIELYTVYEFLNKDFSQFTKDSSIILVDSIAKLLTINDLNIVDAEYFNRCWKILKNKSFEDILDALNKSNLEKIELQYEIRQDYNLGEHTFITHLTEFNKNPYLFCKKIHNILTKTNKETIDCSPKYKELLKNHIINKDMSILYQEFLDKKKQDYPILFKYMKFTINSNYAEKTTEEIMKELFVEEEGAE